MLLKALVWRIGWLWNRQKLTLMPFFLCDKTKRQIMILCSYFSYLLPLLPLLPEIVTDETDLVSILQSSHWVVQLSVKIAGQDLWSESARLNQQRDKYCCVPWLCIMGNRVVGFLCKQQHNSWEFLCVVECVQSRWFCIITFMALSHWKDAGRCMRKPYYYYYYICSYCVTVTACFICSKKVLMKYCYLVLLCVLL